jgi:Right handed beta helix region
MDARRGKRTIAAGAGIAIGASLAAGGSAQADTITVANLGDTGAGSLRDAIFDANHNGPGSDDIVFASGLSGTIDVGSTLDSPLVPATAMVIQGGGRITLHAADDGSGYLMSTRSASYLGSQPGDTITLSGLTLTGGHPIGDGGGIFNREANLVLSDVVVSGNHAGDDGGGIYDLEGSLTLVDSTVTGNTAGDDAHDRASGGAIASEDAPVVIRSSTISGNSSGGDGGGIFMSPAYAIQPSLTIENSTIADNASIAHSNYDEGGGVWICCGGGGQRLDIRSSTISGNSVGGPLGAGGGVYAYVAYTYDPVGRVTIEDTILANNSGTRGNDLFLSNGGEVRSSLVEDPSNSANPPATVTFTGNNILGLDPQLGPLVDNGGLTSTEALAPTSPAVDAGASPWLSSDQRGVQRSIDFPGIQNAAAGDGSDIGAFELQPDNAIRLGKLKRKPARGTAEQIVEVPVPGAGALTIYGRGLKTKTRTVTGSGKVSLPVIPRGAKRRLEHLTGKVRLKANIAYAPIGNAARTLKRKLNLRKL